MRIFSLPDGREVQAGTPFSAYVTLKPGPPPVRDMVQFPANWLALATPADLARIGVTVREIPDPPPSVDQLVTCAADRRRSLANGSATISTGARSIPTFVDAESRGSITALVVALNFAPDLSTPWKGSDGEFYTLTPAELPAFALGMLQFVQACFAAEEIVKAAIAAGTITTFEEIDAFAWPSTT